MNFEVGQYAAVLSGKWHIDSCTYTGAAHTHIYKELQSSEATEGQIIKLTARFRASLLYWRESIWWHRESMVPNTHAESSMRLYPAELGRVSKLIQPQDTANYADTSYWISLSLAGEGRQQREKKRAAQRNPRVSMLNCLIWLWKLQCDIMQM